MERVRERWRETSYERRLDAAITAPRLARCATIAVVSPKGGVGKTTITALLGSLLALLRRDRCVAVDTNPDYGSLGRTLAPEHQVFVDDLLDILERPELTVTELDSNLGRGFDGLMVLPAPTDPARMARLDRDAYARVIKRLQALAGILVLDCGTGLQEPAAQAAMMAADQLVLVSDAEPSTASLVAEASELLERAGPPLTLVVNKMPRSGARLDLSSLEREVPRARGLIVIESDPPRAGRVSAGEYTWTDTAGSWTRSVRELATVLVSDWARLGLTAG
jgi:MinD-like ATPase involved in chromosome partitioning or flagellar assembly